MQKQHVVIVTGIHPNTLTVDLINGRRILIKESDRIFQLIDLDFVCSPDAVEVLYDYGRLLINVKSSIVEAGVRIPITYPQG